MSVTAGGVGLDLSAGRVVVFAKLPPDAPWAVQGEDRVHRRGQNHSVNVYYLVAAGEGVTADERRWAAMERSLEFCGRVVDGDAAAGERGIAPDAFGRDDQLARPAPFDPRELGWRLDTETRFFDWDASECPNASVDRREREEEDAPFALPPPC